jgi:hypothetical protein
MEEDCGGGQGLWSQGKKKKKRINRHIMWSLTASSDDHIRFSHNSKASPTVAATLK